MEEVVNGYKLLDYLFPLVAKAVKPRELISSRRIKNIIGQDSVADIRKSTESNDTQIRRVVELIRNNSPDNGIDILSQVLEDLDFIHLSKILKKEYGPFCTDRIRNLVQAFNDVNVESLKISRSLRDKEIITDLDVQDIETECLNRKEKAALVILVERLAISEKSEWETTLIQCLRDENLETVASRMEDCLMSDELDNEERAEVSPDVQWQKLIMDLFKYLILQNVTADDILGNIGTLLSMEEKRHIRDIAENQGEQMGMEKLLEKVDQISTPGKWQAFKQALVDSDFDWLNDVLEGNYEVSDNSARWEGMINLYEGRLSEKIQPGELLGLLSEESLISALDRQTIEQIEQNKGERRAAVKLLQCLHKLQPNHWYPKFMTILMKNNYHQLVSEIDPDIFKELQKTGNFAVDEYAEVMACTGQNHDVKEAYASVTEKPRRSYNNLSVPNDSKQENKEERHEFIRQQLLSSSDEKKQNQTIPKLDNTGTIDNNIASSYSGNEKKLSKTEKFEDIKKKLAIKTSKKPEEITNNIVETPFDDVSSDSEDDQMDKKPLNLRKYQKELSADANDGKRCVIVAPTGSGKTHVIIDVIQRHFTTNMAKCSISKVVILVEQQALAEQQHKRCKEYLHFPAKLLTGEINREDSTPLSSWLKRRNIFVITAELLVTALRTKDVAIEDFSLLIFDECHHAISNHSYNRIMQYYMERKFDVNFDKSQLPQVIGLTASLGVRKSNSLTGAKEHIKITMAHLDAEKLVTVEKNKAELAENVVIPDKDIIRTPPREEKFFGETISLVMECTEKEMKDSVFADCLEEKSLKAPTEKGSVVYTQWISKLRRDIAAIRNHEATRFFTTCRNYLEVYNQALIIYEDARVKDAMDYLENKALDLSVVNQDATDRKMIEFYELAKSLLLDCTDDENCANPKLKVLKDVIFKQCRENSESRIIVFVETRALAEALVNFMKETNGLNSLKPTKFVGTKAAGTQGGMTRKDQNELITLFKEGEHKVIMATSVAEEGLDIPTCNLVIRYDHVTNETAMIQSRGRGRADDSKFIIIAGEKRGTADKEEKNEIRESIMNDAIEQLKADIKQNREKFLREIEQIQMAEKRRREQEKLAGQMPDGYQDLEMKCEKCRKFICMTSDIRKIQDAHHAIVNDDVKDNIKVVKSNPKRIDQFITVNAGKVKCECGNGLGHIIIHREAQFPVLKVENFTITDTKGKSSYCKKWKSVPGIRLPLTDEDLERRLRGHDYVEL